MKDWAALPATIDRGTLRVGPHAVMWEASRPVYERWFAALGELLRPADSVLEIGYGLGLSARMFQEAGVREHTIVEAHPEIAAHARTWAADKPGVRIVEGWWQDVLPTLAGVSGVFYDSYQVSVEDTLTGFARAALPHLRPGGWFTGRSAADPPDAALLVPLLQHCDEVRLVEIAPLPDHEQQPNRKRLVFPIARKRRDSLPC